MQCAPHQSRVTDISGDSRRCGERGTMSRLEYLRLAAVRASCLRNASHRAPARPEPLMTYRTLGSRSPEYTMVLFTYGLRIRYSGSQFRRTARRGGDVGDVQVRCTEPATRPFAPASVNDGSEHNLVGGAWLRKPTRRSTSQLTSTCSVSLERSLHPLLPSLACDFSGFAGLHQTVSGAGCSHC